VLPRLVIAAALLAAPSAAQDPEALRRTVFHGVAEVNLVNVEVTVTDDRGDPVRGLTRDDFLVRENGRPVEITNFFTVDPDAPEVQSLPVETQPPEETSADETAFAAEQRRLMVYVDNANLTETNRARVFAALRTFLLELLPPETKVMVVTNENGILRVRQPLTPILHDVFYSLEQIQDDAAAGRRFELDEREILRAIEAVDAEQGAGGGESGFLGMKGDVNVEQVEQEARSILPRIERYSAERQQHVEASLAVLEHFIDLVAGLPGRKALLYVGEGLDLRPGAALLEAYSRRFAQVGSVGADAHPELTAARYDTNQTLEALLQRANNGQVTFYTLDAARPNALDRGSAATKAGSGGLFASWDDSYASAREEDRQTALRRLAERTGGRAALGDGAYASLFRGLADDFSYRYSLGYEADSSGDSVREIEVELQAPHRGWTLRHRRTFRNLTPVERAAERAQAALLTEEVGNALTIAVEAMAPAPHEDGGFVVPLMIYVPLGKIVLVPGPEAHQAQVTLFVAVRDDLGRTSPVSRHTCPIRIPNDQLLTALGQTAVCGVRLRMRGGQQRVGVTILDEIASLDSTTYLELDVEADAGEDAGAL